MACRACGNNPDSPADAFGYAVSAMHIFDRIHATIDQSQHARERAAGALYIEPGIAINPVRLAAAIAHLEILVAIEHQTRAATQCVR